MSYFSNIESMIVKSLHVPPPNEVALTEYEEQKIANKYTQLGSVIYRYDEEIISLLWKHENSVLGAPHVNSTIDYEAPLQYATSDVSYERYFVRRAALDLDDTTPLASPALENIREAISSLRLRGFHCMPTLDDPMLGSIPLDGAASTGYLRCVDVDFSNNSACASLHEAIFQRQGESSYIASNGFMILRRDLSALLHDSNIYMSLPSSVSIAPGGDVLTQRYMWCLSNADARVLYYCVTSHVSAFPPRVGWQAASPALLPAPRLQWTEAQQLTIVSPSSSLSGVQDVYSCPATAASQESSTNTTHAQPSINERISSRRKNTKRKDVSALPRFSDDENSEPSLHASNVAQPEGGPTIRDTPSYSELGVESHLAKCSLFVNIVKNQCSVNIAKLRAQAEQRRSQLLLSEPNITDMDESICSEVSSLTGTQSSASSTSLILAEHAADSSSLLDAEEPAYSSPVIDNEFEDKKLETLHASGAYGSNEVSLELFPQYGEAFVSHIAATSRTTPSPLGTFHTCRISSLYAADNNHTQSLVPLVSDACEVWMEWLNSQLPIHEHHATDLSTTGYQVDVLGCEFWPPISVPSYSSSRHPDAAASNFYSDTPQLSYVIRFVLPEYAFSPPDRSEALTLLQKCNSDIFSSYSTPEYRWLLSEVQCRLDQNTSRTDLRVMILRCSLHDLCLLHTHFVEALSSYPLYEEHGPDFPDMFQLGVVEEEYVRLSKTSYLPAFSTPLAADASTAAPRHSLPRFVRHSAARHKIGSQAEDTENLSLKRSRAGSHCSDAGSVMNEDMYEVSPASNVMSSIIGAANPLKIMRNIKSLVDTADYHQPLQQNFAAIETYLRQLFELVIGVEEDDYYKYHISMAQCDADDHPAVLRNMLSTKISELLTNFFDRSCSNPVLNFTAVSEGDASPSVPSVSAAYYMMETVSRLRLQKRKLPWLERPTSVDFGWSLELHLKYTLGKIRLNSAAYKQLIQAQQWRCFGCGEPLLSGMTWVDCNYLPCRYTGKLFCKRWCHRNDHRIIPKQLLYEKDTVPHRVCRQAAAYLDEIWNLPVVNIIALNFTVYEKYPVLIELRNLRQHVTVLIETALSCECEELMDAIKVTLGQRLHICFMTSMYSLQDIQDTLHRDYDLVPVMRQLIMALQEIVMRGTMRCH